MNDQSTNCRNYYVDEAGDGTLFTKKGKVIIGEEGCSKYFILGVLDVPQPEELAYELTQLRSQLLADPYFKKVPSMQKEALKTFYAFHAKDDLPEVRREVFSVLRRYEFRFLAVVRNKLKVLEYVRQRNSIDPTYRYQPNELYDYMVRVLFKNLLHTEQCYNVVFSKRGKQDRTASLSAALQQAQARFANQWHIENHSIVRVYPRVPAQSVALQAVDYFLWSLQRFYEQREDRYLELLWPSFRMVHDMDDSRKALYGVYYTQKRPLTLAAFDDTSPGI